MTSYVLLCIVISHLMAMGDAFPFEWRHIIGGHWAVWNLFGNDVDVCYNPNKGPYEFSYCATAADGAHAAKAPPAFNHYATAAWSSCVARWGFKSTLNEAPCPRNTIRYSWHGNGCLHNEEFWSLPEHMGDPWLKKLPKTPGWDRLSSGVHVDAPKKKHTLDAGEDNINHNEVSTIGTLSLSTYPADGPENSNILGAGRLTRRRDPRVTANLTASLVRRNGVYRFDYCTKNDLEAHLIGYEGRLVSNKAAFQAWVECKSFWPVVHTLEFSVPELCPHGGRSVVWYGRNCYHSLEYYNSQPFADDPKLSHRHQHGCGSGIHAEIAP